MSEIKTVFGIPMLVSDDVPPDEGRLVSHTFDHASGEMVVLDTVRLVNLEPSPSPPPVV